MAQGFGGFDTTYYGPTYTEDIEAIERGMQQGLQIGASVRQARAQNERQQADIEAQRQRDLAAKMTLDKIDESVKEGLILPAESKSDNLNDARMDFSNVLIDKLNQLKIARDNGDITNADYQKSVQVLNAQIPAFKSAEKVIYTGVEQFLDGLENGTLSNSIKTKDFQFWSALARGEANVSYKVDKNGGIVLDGTWKDVDGVEHAISASLAEMDRLPFVSTKPETTAKQHIQADVKNILDTKEGNAMRRFDEASGKYVENIEDFTKEDGSYKPWFSQFAEESFEGYFNGLGRGDRRKALREYLMDSIEIGQRKELMDKLGGKELTSYGVKSLDDILEDKSITDINKFINNELKQNWIGQAKEAVLQANKDKISESNFSTQQAQLELRKDIANTRKAEAQAGSAQLDYAQKSKNSSSKNELKLTPTQQRVMEFYQKNKFKSGVPYTGDWKEDLRNLGIQAIRTTDDDGVAVVELSSGTKAFNSGKPITLDMKAFNDPDLLFQKISESWTDPATNKPVDYNAIKAYLDQQLAQKYNIDN